MRFLQTALVITALAVPLSASAQYVDVIVSELTDQCTLEQYLPVVEEFRGVMSSQGYGYTVEILQPLTGEDVNVLYWVGRTKDFATFGADYSKWEAALQNAGSPEAAVSEKINKCTRNLSRSGSLVR